MDNFKRKFIKVVKRIWDAFVLFWQRKHLTQVLLLGLLVVILGSILWFAFIASQANVQSLKDGLNQATIIYDKDGDVAGSVANNRTNRVSFDQLPDHVTNAVIAIEDERFYEHNGFDIKGIARAFFNNLFAGSITGGGSTLTQQLTKNALLSQEQTYKRKVEELFLAVEIEKVYEKEEILEMYLNQSYFGSGAWGIGNASKKYFNKEIEEVTISEAALLAGLLKAPSSLDPYKNYEKALDRRDIVLSQMKKLGKISADEYDNAIKQEIKLEDGGGSLIDRKYPYYMDAVLDEAINQYGLTQEEILTRGYTIYTQLDQNLQAGLENVYANNQLFPNSTGTQTVQSGAVLIDPKTGGVRALVGGRGEYVFRGFNRATHLKAQPGSTMKPLAVYIPALEEGYKYNSMLKDEKQTFGDYSPENFSKTYQGEVPMYTAVENSINLPAVWLLNEIGLQKGVNAVENFGIPVQEEDKNLALALGGMHKGISPQQLAEAYSTFANDGVRNESHIITKIVGPTGNIIGEYKEKSVRVTTKKVAGEMTSMLLNVVETGTGQATKIADLQIAGKTGSTQLPYKDISGTKDQWFVGYTPNLVGAVWIGYDQTDRNHYLPNSSSRTVVPIFREIMVKASPHIEKVDFPVDSINDRLQDSDTNNLNEVELKEQAEKLEEELKKAADKVEEKLKEEAPKWKEVLEKAKEDTSHLGDKVKDRLEDWLP
ncbi:PBP1A family penicillin-binding protein [Mesobacillus maritimus]|uniref:PBP1A family penicillin-binding protein n=1 Tax=Mesobacillus maritimus TaxID=1643336 RepID=UPI002040B71A|nr:PBP1A family penicillin-binding protein [Mesobacillus maritimus]MCM3585992.1 PBP1A family penicillin-binding protein [Mesobacillus maritimus]MCM3670347.1 PBP1A family penicillin-binding protein [Mesobacillus maritimus]